MCYVISGKAEFGLCPQALAPATYILTPTITVVGSQFSKILSLAGSGLANQHGCKTHQPFTKASLHCCTLPLAASSRFRSPWCGRRPLPPSRVSELKCLAHFLSSIVPVPLFLWLIRSSVTKELYDSQGVEMAFNNHAAFTSFDLHRFCWLIFAGIETHVKLSEGAFLQSKSTTANAADLQCWQKIISLSTMPQGCQLMFSLWSLVTKVMANRISGGVKLDRNSAWQCSLKLPKNRLLVSVANISKSQYIMRYSRLLGSRMHWLINNGSSRQAPELPPCYIYMYMYKLYIHINYI